MLIAIIFMLAATGLLVLLIILSTVFGKGMPALSLGFLTEPSSDFGAEGGVFYQIIGTLILTVGALAIALPLAVGTTLFQTECLRSHRLKAAFRAVIYSLNAMPTILFGLAGYVLFGVYLGAGVSWLTGALILGIMILPTIQASIQEAVEGLPEKYRETGTSLGMTPWALAQNVVLPLCWHGAVTGGLLGLARAAGETAAIMFTAAAFSGATFPQSFKDPVPTLQTHILVLAQDASQASSLTNAWGAASVLLLMVFLLILFSLWVRNQFSMEAQR
ncbi:MAG: ABC transporter permease subunit [Candidatus Nitrohelix vancouverensis]|uniref:ABC transporter permease subunit n=1 Tax=Candidatus Nitrohelix vancouverensis TaxID=2705534 RepID=A0A7T0C2A2_9BACT|nr:MAG: ABC transporter permease subunit [Candidatus Nitrohelix vancouverensis]